MIHPLGSSSHRGWMVETEVCVVCTARIEIRTGIDLKRTKPAMGLNLHGEVTESTVVADAVWMRLKLTSERMKLNGNDLP